MECRSGETVCMGRVLGPSLRFEPVKQSLEQPCFCFPREPVAFRCERLEEDVRFELCRCIEAVSDIDDGIIAAVKECERDVEVDGCEAVGVEIIEESYIDSVTGIELTLAIAFDGLPIRIKHPVIRHRCPRRDRVDTTVLGSGVKRDLAAETRAKEYVRCGTELIDDSTQISEFRAECLVDELAIGLTTAAKIEPDGVVSFFDGSLTPMFVAPGLIAEKAVTEDDPVVSGCLVVDGSDSLTIDHRNSVLCFGHWFHPRWVLS